MLKCVRALNSCFRKVSISGRKGRCFSTCLLNNNVYEDDNILLDNMFKNLSKKKQKEQYLYSTIFGQISEKMKEYEKNQGNVILPNQPFMARLDGHKFSTFTAPFRKPFDELLHFAMVCTSSDLLKTYPAATTAFTFSDEITLVFPSLPEKDIYYSGRILKYSTLLSSFASVRFNYHCHRLLDKWPTKEEYVKACKEKIKTKSYSREKVIENINKSQTTFDCRIFNVKEKGELLENIRWRSNFDCERNSVNNLGRCVYSAKSLINLNIKEVIKKLNAAGIDWEAYPYSFRNGTFVKKMVYNKSGVNGITGENTITQRTRIDARSFKLDSFDERYTEFLLADTWNVVLENNLIPPKVLGNELTMDVQHYDFQPTFIHQ
ncbi:hypothetical protein ABK040_005785 [Willaertia magna]